MERQFNYDILPLIQTRWSSRALSDEKIDRTVLSAIIEAARYAPSCFNEQPWHFIVADSGEILNQFRAALSPGNQVWAGKAPVLIAACAKKIFSANGKDNFWHQFDTGTAWGYMSLEAERTGLISHGMAGFDRTATAQAAKLPPEYEVIAMIAVGRPGSKDSLPPDYQEREKPGTRKELKEICSFGVFGKRD